MKAVGLIVEYNPFHNGHAYHLQQSKLQSSAEAVVAVMSGHFLQRGEPALLDKWTRTEMALQGGCDLVIELPVAYATSSAEWFAYGAVSLLEATGVVDSFCFGSESGQLAPLEYAAKIAATESKAFQASLDDKLKTGSSYPHAYSSVLSQFYEQSQQSLGNAITEHEGNEPFRFDLPNHTLGLHYLIAKERLNSQMKPLTITREKAQYHDDITVDQRIASATAIRKLLLEDGHIEAIKSYVPPATYQILQQQFQAGIPPMHWDMLATALFHLLLTSSSEQLANIREIEEGLQHRMKQAVPKLSQWSVEALLTQLKTKRYTRTKLQRALLAILLQHNKTHFQRAAMKEGLQYIRVLGFTERGQQLLKAMKKRASLPIIHSPAAFSEPSFFLQLDIQATAVYNLAKLPHSPKASIQDYTQSPIRI